MPNKKVSILLSTYNGEKYLKAQLKSLTEQKYDNLEIIIRDDGSTDSTREILRDFSKNYINLILYFEENIGVKRSFFRLMELAKGRSDYYAFCDQDDVWDPDKILKAVESLESLESEVRLYCSALNLVDEDLNFIKKTKNLKADKRNAMIQNIVTGCTSIISNKLLEISLTNLPEETKIEMHDSWLYLIGVFFGEVYFDSNSYILYRQHSSNEVGMPSNRIQILKNSYFGLKNEYKYKIHTKQLQEFYKIYCKTLNNSDKKLIETFLYNKTSMMRRFKILKKTKVFKQSKIKTLGFRIMFVLNLV